jgi:DNA-binding MarR family transcriptional regulator
MIVPLETASGEKVRMPMNETTTRGADQPSFQVLLWLLRHPFQRVEDITLALACHQATTYRHVAQYEHEGLIESVSPALGGRDTCRLYYLTSAGLAAVARHLRTSPAQLARVWGVDERGLLRLLPRLHALVSLQDLINGLVRYAPAALALPGGLRADITWNWRLDFERHFTFKNKAMTAHVDAVLVFRREEQNREPTCFLLWLLLDSALTGEHDGRLVQGRLEALLGYRECSERRAFYDAFPPVVILTPTRRQQALWCRAARDAANSLAPTRGIAPLHGAIVTVPPDTLYESAWPLAWHSLSADASCHLQDLLVPTPEAALPLHTLSSTSERAVSASARAAPIQGSYSKRARMVSAEIRKDEDAERDSVALLSLLFSRRHLEVLQCLYSHPVTETWELAAFCQLEVPSAERYLSELRRYSCVQKLDTKSGQRWALSPRGLRLVAARHHFGLLHIATPSKSHGQAQAQEQRGQARLVEEAGHTAALYGFFARLHLAARRAGGQVLWWERGARCERRYRESGAWHNFRPDAFLEYAQDEQRLLAWLECDQGTMDMRSLAAKLHAYAYYIRSGRWREHGLVTLPMLLCIVPEKGQFQRVAYLAREILAPVGLVVRITTATRLAQYGPLGEIWLEVLPQRPGQGYARRRLLDLSVEDAQSSPGAGKRT